MFVALPAGMLGKSNHIQINKQRNLWLEAGINHCSFILFGFFFAWGSPSALSITRGAESGIHKNFTSHLSEYSFNSPDHPFHSPFESVPLPDEPKALEECGQEDNFDDDFDPLIWNQLSEYKASFSYSLRSDFFQIIQSFHNRSKISLFILYHSWKSFLRN